MDLSRDKKLKVICCECGDTVQDGTTIDGHVSHGYCDRCYSVIMAFIKGVKPKGIDEKAKTIRAG